MVLPFITGYMGNICIRSAKEELEIIYKHVQYIDNISKLYIIENIKQTKSIGGTMNKFRVSNFVYALLIAAFAFGAFAAPAVKAAPKSSNTIVDVALAANAQTGEFSILIAALQAADPSVIQTLSGKGQFTVFAPTDAAFVALLNELGLTAGELLGNQALVTKVLLYHVAPGNRDSADVLGSSRIRTLQRGFLFQSGGVLTDVNGRSANIIATDFKASNGVIHVIDRVVLP
jgi:uncharacterized surface protein with fasciclin (FAS1) repeats